LSNTKKFILKLYVSGATPHSTRAVKNITAICQEHLRNDYSLEIIDIYQKPQFAKSDQIIAVPTLLKCQPKPMRRLVGDMSVKDKVLIGLDIEEMHD
jgi:circadian clock protein KaiB